jgi:dolichol-phosphate mannosyltransferase
MDAHGCVAGAADACHDSRDLAPTAQAGSAVHREKERRVRLLIAIPVYNERRYVGKVLGQVLKFHPDVLVMDDGSTDGTCEILSCRRDLQIIRHPRNMGYGQSLIDAFALADAQRYDWVITMDCDEQHEPESIPDFIREIQSDRWDVVSGSRYLRTGQQDDLPPEDRRTINATVTQMVNDLFGLKLTDSFCGFKAHRVSAMRKLVGPGQGLSCELVLAVREIPPSDLDRKVAECLAQCSPVGGILELRLDLGKSGVRQVLMVSDQDHALPDLGRPILGGIQNLRFEAVLA